VAQPWRVLIVDDEPAARRGVRQLLGAFPAFEVVGECRDGAEALASLDALTPHVVFLDIQMPGLDGFEVIRRRTPERMPAVVFLTAYDQFAIRAFETEAFDYLLKPVSAERFGATMARLIRRLKADTPAAADPVFVVTSTRGAVMVPFREVDWIEAEDKYVRIWTGARSYLLREPMRDVERRVRGHGFARAHRRALVRLEAAREVTVTTAGRLVVVLATGGRVPVSRRRRAAFMAAVKRRAQSR
jgi:two-component system, LytTR family, response regulator